jgi:hypothetical protein
MYGQTQEARTSSLQAEIEDLQRTLGYVYRHLFSRLVEIFAADVRGIRETGDAEKIVQHHIKLLHQYNEAKDATQASRSIVLFYPHSTSY